MYKMSVKEERYSADAPVLSPEQDLFSRWPFSQRVAQVIANRLDPSSIVIGIYGAWGEGKTSVFNFIEHALQQQNHVVCIHFNPWRFSDEEEMLISFFNDLATAIDRSIVSKKEKVGEIVKKYAKPLADALGQGAIAEGVSNLFSGADLTELRERIEAILEEERKRVVVFVDDIDRLDKNEIHAVFRLIKLTADFKYTAYILAFDPDIVAAALQERYTAESKHAGKAFLEKIIQIPLQLPVADQVDLRNYCFSDVNEALRLADIHLSGEQAQDFVNNFIRGIEVQLLTPRQAKLYTNTLMFSLPILHGEVNAVDLMLIEAIRIFYPTVYELIRKDPELFLNTTVTGYSRRDEDLQGKRDQIEKVLNDYPLQVRDGLKELLQFLFPKLRTIFSNMYYDNEAAVSWERQQRICSKQYFKRYFTYSIPRGDIADATITQLLDQAKVLAPEEMTRILLEYTDERSADRFIAKLRRRSNECDEIQSRCLAQAVAMIGDRIPNPIQFFSFTSAFSQAAAFISDLMMNVASRENRVSLAQGVMDVSETLDFAAECFWFLKKDQPEKPEPEGFSMEELKAIGMVLSERLQEKFITNPEAWFLTTEKMSLLFYIWQEYGEPESAKRRIEQAIVQNPELAIKLLIGHLGTAWGSGSNVPRKGEFARETYNRIAELINPRVVAEAIQNIFTAEQLFGSEWIDEEKVGLNRRVASEFIGIHKHVTQEQLRECASPTQ